MLALINDKLRQPCSSATTFDLGVLSRMTKQEAPCEKALSASDPNLLADQVKLGNQCNVWCKINCNCRHKDSTNSLKARPTKRA